MNDVRPIDANALLTVPNVRKVDEFDETGESVSYLAVPVECIEKAPTIGYAPKWISVKDRLPEEKKGEPSDLVLVACVYWETDEVFINTDITVDGEWVNFGEPDYEITHWMPLPEPPKEDA